MIWGYYHFPYCEMSLPVKKIEKFRIRIPSNTNKSVNHLCVELANIAMSQS